MAGQSRGADHRIMGRMGEARKGFTVFAQAAKIVHEAFPSARFLVAGDGQEDGEKTLDAIGADKGLRKCFELWDV